MSRKATAGTTRASKVSLERSSGSSCTIGTMPPETKPRRRSSNTSRCSTIGSVGTQPSAMTPRPRMKRGQQSRNHTKSREDHGCTWRQKLCKYEWANDENVSKCPLKLIFTQTRERRTDELESENTCRSVYCRK